MLNFDRLNPTFILNNRIIYFKHAHPNKTLVHTIKLINSFSFKIRPIINLTNAIYLLVSKQTFVIR